MPKNIIITGAMGSGKSTVLQLLKQQGFIVVPEPAREILAEQRAIGDEGVPEKNSKLFTQLLLSRAIYQYTQMQNKQIQNKQTQNNQTQNKQMQNTQMQNKQIQITQIQMSQEIVIFDRGIPDNIAYAQLFNLNYLPAYQAAKLYRYYTDVFIFPAWSEIYTTDDERTMSFKAAKLFGEDVRRIYKEIGYNLIDVPLISPSERAHFIINHI